MSNLSVDDKLDTFLKLFKEFAMTSCKNYGTINDNQIHGQNDRQLIYEKLTEIESKIEELIGKIDKMNYNITELKEEIEEIKEKA